MFRFFRPILLPGIQVISLLDSPGGQVFGQASAVDSAADSDRGKNQKRRSQRKQSNFRGSARTMATDIGAQDPGIRLPVSFLLTGFCSYSILLASLTSFLRHDGHLTRHGLFRPLRRCCRSAVTNQQPF